MTRQKGEDVFIVGVLLGGTDIFWVKGDDDEEISIDEEGLLIRSSTRIEWEKSLAHALLLPTRLLKVSYPKRPDVPLKLRLPYHWTVEVKPTLGA